MVWGKSLACIVFLTTAMAYNSPFYSSFYARSQYRRMDDEQDFGEADTYQERTVNRTSNERSIPNRSDAQKLLEVERRIKPSDEMLRNGNTTYKFGNSVTNRRAVPDSSAIVFPETRRWTPMTQFVPEIPPECEEMGFCDEVPNYPQEHVDNLIAQAGPSVSRYFDVTVLTPEITQRRGSEEEVKELCDYDERIHFPQAAKNLDGKWFFVLNKKEKQVQGFKVQICKTAYKPCDKIAYIQPIYRHECGQAFTPRLIVGMNKGGELMLETVNTPSCCTCFIKTVTPDF